MYQYSVLLTPHPESGFKTVGFPDIPEAITQGRDVSDALTHAVDALETALSIYMDKRQDIPVPRKVRGGYYVDLPPISAAKVALYSEMRAAGMKKTELARRLGWQKSQVDPLLDMMHKSRLDQLEQALRVLGRVIVLKVKSRPEMQQTVRVAS